MKYSDLTPAELQAVFDNPDIAEMRAERRITKAADAVTKKFLAHIEKDAVSGLAPGQFTIRLTGPGLQVDGDGDITVPHGAVGRDGKASGDVPFLVGHDVTKPGGRCAWRPVGSGPTAALLGTVTIPLGITDYADECYALIKAGVITDVSIGFTPLERERIPTGWKWVRWILCEVSAVAIGSLPSAVILSKGQTPMISAAHQAARDSAAELGRKGRMDQLREFKRVGDIDAVAQAAEAARPAPTRAERVARALELAPPGHPIRRRPLFNAKAYADRADRHGQEVAVLQATSPTTKAGRIAAALALAPK